MLQEFIGPSYRKQELSLVRHRVWKAKCWVGTVPIRQAKVKRELLGAVGQQFCGVLCAMCCSKGLGFTHHNTIIHLQSLVLMLIRRPIQMRKLRPREVKQNPDICPMPNKLQRFPHSWLKI